MSQAAALDKASSNDLLSLKVGRAGNAALLQQQQQPQPDADSAAAAGGVYPADMQSLVSLAAKQAAKEEELAEARRQVRRENLFVLELQTANRRELAQ